jgi:predicted transcriptional regulator
MTRCTICSSPHRAAIDDLLDAGTSQKDVAEQFGVSRFAVSRHVRHSAPAPETSSGDSREEISKWLSRADDQYLVATADGDQRGAINALVGGLRAVEARIRNEEREAEAPDVAESDEFTERDIAKFDRLLAESDTRTNLLAIEGAQRLGYSDLFQLFEACHGNPALKAAVLAFATEWAAAQENTGDTTHVPQIAN